MVDSSMGDSFDNFTLYGLKPVVGYPISAKFGDDRTDLAAKLNLKHKTHRGIDFACPVGTEIKAYLDGIVQLAGQEESFGTRIWIYSDIPEKIKAVRHGYMHLTDIQVLIGHKVKQGDIIGHSGATGKTTGPHLHFEILRNGVQISPLSVLQ